MNTDNKFTPARHPGLDGLRKDVRGSPRDSSALGAASGAAFGAAAGSLGGPVSAAVGAIVGGMVGAVSGILAGDTNKKENNPAPVDEYAEEEEALISSVH